MRSGATAISRVSCLLGLASVEAYSYKTNEWFFVAPMNTRRSSVGVGVVEGEEQLWEAALPCCSLGPWLHSCCHHPESDTSILIGRMRKAGTQRGQGAGPRLARASCIGEHSRCPRGNTCVSLWPLVSSSVTRWGIQSQDITQAHKAVG